MVYAEGKVIFFTNDMADRIVLHCDCNSFFASVETVLAPQYKDVPMAVCGSYENRHGIVLAKNELAKCFHAKSNLLIRKKINDINNIQEKNIIIY